MLVWEDLEVAVLNEKKIIYNRILKRKTVHGDTHLSKHTVSPERKYKEPFPHHFKEPSLGRRTGGEFCFHLVSILLDCSITYYCYF